MNDLIAMLIHMLFGIGPAVIDHGLSGHGFPTAAMPFLPDLF